MINGLPTYFYSNATYITKQRDLLEMIAIDSLCMYSLLEIDILYKKEVQSEILYP